MKWREIERLLDRLVVAVPAGVRRAGIKPNACILATRLGVETLRARGVRARPLSVALRIYNPQLAGLIDRGEHEALSEEQLVASGARVLTIDTENVSGLGGWPGHLVAVVAERYLLDLSAVQFHRPEKGIDARAFWAECRDLARGEPDAFRDDGGAVWVYEPRPEDRSFLAAPAWSAYRVRPAADGAVSERSGPAAADEPVAPMVRVRLGVRA